MIKFMFINLMVSVINVSSISSTYCTFLSYFTPISMLKLRSLSQPISNQTNPCYLNFSERLCCSYRKIPLKSCLVLHVQPVMHSWCHLVEIFTYYTQSFCATVSVQIDLSASSVIYFYLYEC